jgi:formate hydrogenlyase subunit 3/multisubunit Na+/H+ antiporter MnhD subunit
MLSIFIPLLGSLFCLIFPGKMRGVWSVIIVSLSFVFLLFLLPSIMLAAVIRVNLGVSGSGFFSFSFLADGISLIFALVFSFIGIIILLYSLTYMKPYHHQKEYYFITTLMISSLVGISFSANLMLLYIFWEVAALSAWRLYGFFRGKKEVIFANKAFLLTFLGSSFMLLGFILIYQTRATLDLVVLRGQPVSNLALFLILLGIIAKSATLPIQVWMPDAYSGAPSPVCALSSALIAKIGVFAFVRIFLFTFTVSWDWILWLAVISSLVGAAAALREKNIKRIIAYSTVSQIGFILLGLALVGKIGLLAGLLYFVIHAVGKTGLFLGAGIVEQRCKESNLDQLGGLAKAMPVTAAGFLFCSLSIMGFPPFGGFYAKLMVILATVKEGHFWIAGLAIFTAILTMLYLFRLFNGIFLGQRKISFSSKGRRSMVACVLFLGIVSLAIGLFIGQLLGLPHIAVAQIFR